MERLTARNKTSPKEAYYPYCFQNDTCNGQGPSDKCDKCPLTYHICETLADYEDTGLTPPEVMEMKERDTAKAAEEVQDAFGDGRLICPNCRNSVINYFNRSRPPQFCMICGQRLKWEE